MVMRKRFPATCSDREAAVGLLGRLARLDSSYAHFDDIALRISEGGHDDTIWVQVFAAHRLTTLAALVEPSDTMLMAGNEAALSTVVLMDDARFACERATWAAMIAAFLAEQPA